MLTPVTADAELIDQIRASARALPNDATEVSIMLQKYADEIEATATREVALKRFDEFAWHYKGLRDLIVPGVTQKDWTKLVRCISKSARAAINARKPPSWWRRLFQ